MKLDHETGAEIETSHGTAGVLTPAEIALGLLTVLPGVTRVRVWEDGRSVLHDKPSADATPKPMDGPTPVDEALRQAREALADVETIANLGAALSSALDGLVTPTSDPPKWITQWRCAAANGGAAWPAHSMLRENLPPA